jgi:hypothetical protein
LDQKLKHALSYDYDNLSSEIENLQSSQTYECAMMQATALAPFNYGSNAVGQIADKLF